MKAIFITVRTASKRFPQKCLQKIGDRMVIERVIERAKLSKRADRIILCTTTLPEDNILCDVALGMRILCLRGSSEDKLMRWKRATERYKIDFFVTADADDLLCDPELNDMAFDQHDRTGADFIEAQNVPCGAFTYGIKTEALNKVCDIKNTYDTEMMVPYFKETNLFKVEELQNVPIELQRPEFRMTLDYEDDLKFFKAIFDKFDSHSKLNDIIAYLDEHPEIPMINSYLQEKYLTNQKNLTRMVLREDSSINV